MHTGVYYIRKSAEVHHFCTIWDSAEHGPPTVWAYMEPVITTKCTFLVMAWQLNTDRTGISFYVIHSLPAQYKINHIKIPRGGSWEGSFWWGEGVMKHTAEKLVFKGMTLQHHPSCLKNWEQIALFPPLCGSRQSGWSQRKSRSNKVAENLGQDVHSPSIL